MNNLRHYRKLRHLTQSDLAHRIGVSRTSIHNAETGRLSLALAERCASVLSTNKYELLGKDAIMGEPTNKELIYVMNEISNVFKGQHVFHKGSFNIVRECVVGGLECNIIMHEYKEGRGEVYTARIYSHPLESSDIWSFNKEDLEN